MTTRLNPEALPLDWSKLPGAGGLVFSGDIRVSRGSSLRAKVLVFDKVKSMQEFWVKGLGRGCLSRDVRAVTSPLDWIVSSPGRADYRRVDPTYFCALGFVKGCLTMEVIAHESVHGAFIYAARVGVSKRWPDDHEPEERICYPAGRIAAEVNKLFHNARLYETEKIQDRKRPVAGNPRVSRRRAPRPGDNG